MSKHQKLSPTNCVVLGRPEEPSDTIEERARLLIQVCTEIEGDARSLAYALECIGPFLSSRAVIDYDAFRFHIERMKFCREKLEAVL